MSIRKRAVIIAGASRVWEDRKAASDMLRDSAIPDLIIGVNKVGMELPYLTDWVSLHADQLLNWDRVRRARFYNRRARLWTADHIIDNMKLHGDPDLLSTEYLWDGTSTALAVFVAAALRCDRVLLIGAPLIDGPHYYEGESFTQSSYTRPFWEENADCLTNVRSMSGWTAELLGKPTPEWWEGETNGTQS